MYSFGCLFAGSDALHVMPHAVGEQKASGGLPQTDVTVKLIFRVEDSTSTGVGKHGTLIVQTASTIVIDV